MARMERDELVDYCLGKPGAEETYPWGEEELVAKVGGKGFAFIGPGTVSVKGGRDAAEAAEWRPRYPGAVTTSHYVGRYGWNSVDWTARSPTTRSVSWSTPPTTRWSPLCRRAAGRPSVSGTDPRNPPFAFVDGGAGLRVSVGALRGYSTWRGGAGAPDGEKRLTIARTAGVVG